MFVEIELQKVAAIEQNVMILQLKKLNTKMLSCAYIKFGWVGVRLKEKLDK